jgi:hypothetical protein
MDKHSTKPTHAAEKSAAENTEQASKDTKHPHPLPDWNIEYFIEYITEALNHFVDANDMDNAMTGRQRQRLFGAGVRNYGFIEKAFDIARDNPDFLPAQFDAEQFGANIAEFDEYRQLYFLLEKFLAAVNEAMLVRSDGLFREAVRGQPARDVQGAWSRRGTAVPRAAAILPQTPHRRDG